ncbi:SphA family protein [Bradyrhizobium sp. PMVTL-01]|uniref:SphA family protein n=1 Tax=Bradyrhizobium sp. PMVTL-01 TaxID=3434999 RepID=UPI003F703BAA
MQVMRHLIGSAMDQAAVRELQARSPYSRVAMMARALVVGGIVVAAGFQPRMAMGSEAGIATKPGIFLGASAADPSPGIYMFNQVFTFQATQDGPGALPGTHQHVAVDVQGLLFVPGWEFLGAAYTAVVAQPWVQAGVNGGSTFSTAGMNNTYIAPIELSWNLGQGYFAKAGLGMYVPDGSITGPLGISDVGRAYWTFQPEFALSYLKGGWNLTAWLYEEFNTASTVSGYRTGDIFHVDLTATKTIDKWTIGPVAYFYSQVSSDKTSVLKPINNGRYEALAVGGLLGYNFGPANLTVWATDEVYHRAWGATPGIGGADVSAGFHGFTVLGSLSYQLTSFDQPATPQRPMIHK